MTSSKVLGSRSRKHNPGVRYAWRFCKTLVMKTNDTHRHLPTQQRLGKCVQLAHLKMPKTRKQPGWGQCAGAVQKKTISTGVACARGVACGNMPTRTKMSENRLRECLRGMGLGRTSKAGTMAVYMGFLRTLTRYCFSSRGARIHIFLTYLCVWCHYHTLCVVLLRWCGCANAYLNVCECTLVHIHYKHIFTYVHIYTYIQMKYTNIWVHNDSYALALHPAERETVYFIIVQTCKVGLHSKKHPIQIDAGTKFFALFDAPIS